MKKIIILTVFIIALMQAAAYFEEFPENPANIATRDFGDVILPFFDLNAGFNNSNFKLSDLDMFEKGHILTDAEKGKFTSSDLCFSGFSRINLLSFGLKNWEFSLNSYSRGDIYNLDKELMEIVFYGNSEDSYEFNLLEDSRFYQFTKGRFNWAYPKNLNLAFIPIFDFAHKNSSPFVYTMQDILNYIRQMDLYLGLNINMYNANGYAGVVESRQTFITSPDSLYMDSNLQVVMPDEDMEVSSEFNFGAGFGMKLDLPSGWLHIAVDDLGGKLQYDGLVKQQENNYILDYLDFLDEDHETVDESESIEDIPYPEGVEIKFDPTFLLGAEYDFGSKFSVSAKYLNCDYVLDGLFLSTTYRPLNWLPFRLTYGAGDVNSFKFDYGFVTRSFEIMIGVINYDGIFNGSKGYGTDFGIRFKF